MRSSDFAFASLVFFALTLARPAFATEEDAKTFFADGRKHRLENDCQAAIQSFRRALELYPEGLGSLRNIAECEEQLGEFASARNDYWALRRAALSSNEAKYVGWEKDAEAGYNRLATKVAKITVKIEGEQLERVRVSIDGKPLDPRLYGVPLERDLGQHNIEATYGGASPVVARRVLEEGANIVVTLAIPSRAETAARASASPEGKRDVTSLRTGGFIALGVGAASLIVAGISLGVRQGALSTIEATCPNYQTAPCPASLQSDKSRGDTASTLFNIFGIAGLAGAATGATLLVLASRSSGAPNAEGPPPPTAAFSIVPSFAGAQARAEVRF